MRSSRFVADQARGATAHYDSLAKRNRKVAVRLSRITLRAPSPSSAVIRRGPRVSSGPQELAQVSPADCVLRCLPPERHERVDYRVHVVAPGSGHPGTSEDEHLQ